MSLILTRTPGQGITIFTPYNQEITLMIADRRGNQIKIMIDAPEDYKILRDEIITKYIGNTDENE